MSIPNVDVVVRGPIQPSSTYKTKVLKGNHSFASQVTEANMKYVIKYDFDLNGGSVTIPENCVLEFDGGSITGGFIVLNNTTVDGNPIFNCDVYGSVKNEVVDLTWFGIEGNTGEDCSIAFDRIQKLDLGNHHEGNVIGQKTLYIPSGIYHFSKTIVIPALWRSITIHGDGLSTKLLFDLENSIDGVKVLAYNTMIYDIVLQGKHNVSNTTFTGLILDRTNGLDDTDDEHMNNDTIVKNCIFSTFGKGISIVGRQVKIEDCTFSKCFIGVEINRTSAMDSYQGGAGRGYAIHRCHFHAMFNNGSDLDVEGAKHYYTEFAAVVNKSNCYDVSIISCIMDSTSNFYSGQLIHSRIIGNTYSQADKNFIFSEHINRSVISDNTISGQIREATSPAWGTKYPSMEKSAIVAEYISDTIISNNIFGENYCAHIVSPKYSNLAIVGNTFKQWSFRNNDKYAAILLTDGTQYPYDYRRNLYVTGNIFEQNYYANSCLVFAYYYEGRNVRSNAVICINNATIPTDVKSVAGLSTDKIECYKDIKTSITTGTDINSDTFMENGIYPISSVSNVANLPPSVEANSKLIVEHVNSSEIIRTIIPAHDYGITWVQHISGGQIRGWRTLDILKTTDGISNGTQTNLLANIDGIVHISLWKNNKIVWKPLSDFKSGNTRPTINDAGACYFDTTIGKPIWWNGTKWVLADGTDA